MTAGIGALLFGMVWSWNEARWRDKVVAPLMGVAAAWMLFDPVSALGATAVVAGLMATMDSIQRRLGADRKRSALAQFWRRVAIYLSAGATFWQAVDGALYSVPEISKAVRELASGIDQGFRPYDGVRFFQKAHPGPEGELVATMMVHGYRHGLSASKVIAQATELEERLAFERDLRRRNSPLWLTLLPALLLIGVIGLFAVPMAILFGRSWHVLW